LIGASTAPAPLDEKSANGLMFDGGAEVAPGKLFASIRHVKKFINKSRT
jgi:hypothetical protein